MEQHNRIATPDAMRVVYAPWFGGLFEESGSIRFKIRRDHGKARSSPLISVGKRDNTIVDKLHSIFGGNLVQRKQEPTAYWELSQRDAITFALALREYAPSRRDEIDALLSGTPLSKPKGIQRPEGVAGEYEELLNDPYFFAGAIDAISFSENDQIVLQTTNKALLYALATRLEVKVDEQTPSGTEFSTRRGRTYTSINAVYRARVTNSHAEKLRQQIAPYSPLTA